MIESKRNHPRPRVLAITLNWKQAGVTLECVAALLAMQTRAALDILVIDNGSDNPTAEPISSVHGQMAPESEPPPTTPASDVAYLRQELPPTVELLALPLNLGFGQGNNVGLRQAIARGYEYALLINNDAFVAKDMLDQLLAGADQSVALVSPKIYYESQPDILWFAGGRQHPQTLDLIETGRGLPDGPEWSASRDVDYLLGTCLLVNLSAAATVGLFDERFFMYFEDLDWSIRLRQAGYRLRLSAGAHLYHRVAASSGGLDSPPRRYHLARSGVIFWRSHLRQGNPAAILLFRLGSAIKMLFRLAVSGQWISASAYWRGLIDGWGASVEGVDGARANSRSEEAR